MKKILKEMEKLKINDFSLQYFFFFFEGEVESCICLGLARDEK